MIFSMETDFTSGLRATVTLVNGLKGKCMVSGSFTGKMDLNISDSIETILSMERDKWSGILLKGTEVIGHMVKNMGMANR